MVAGVRIVVLLMLANMLAGCGGEQTRVVLPQNALAPIATWVADVGLDWVEIEGLSDATTTGMSIENTPVTSPSTLPEIAELGETPTTVPDASQLTTPTLETSPLVTPTPSATIMPTATVAIPSDTPTSQPTATLSPSPVASATQAVPTDILPASTVGDGETVGCAPVGSGSIESQVIALINEIRRNRGLATLTSNVTLTSAARAHSQDMGCNGFFSHTSPSTGSPFDRLLDAGYSYSWAGENIAAGYSGAGATVDAWMQSAGHRENILGENYTQIGIGYAYVDGSLYGVYITAVFASP